MILYVYTKNRDWLHGVEVLNTIRREMTAQGGEAERSYTRAVDHLREQAAGYAREKKQSENGRIPYRRCGPSDLAV